jgi:hypothetical protein
MTHLDIWNTSYGQKKGRKSNWQFEKLGIAMISSCASGVQHTVGKISTKTTTFHQTSSQSEVFTEITGPQSCGIPNFENFRTPIWESQDKMPFKCRPRGEAQNILLGGRWWFPPSLGCGESYESEFALDSF